jgi:hypothetical protein
MNINYIKKFQANRPKLQKIAPKVELEPSTSCLSGVPSNQLSYRSLIEAGDENRTHNISLEG